LVRGDDDGVNSAKASEPFWRSESLFNIARKKKRSARGQDQETGISGDAI
jgi:hypothetical protein